jgi:micrococcal nuclease
MAFRSFTNKVFKVLHLSSLPLTIRWLVVGSIAISLIFFALMINLVGYAVFSPVPSSTPDQVISSPAQKVPISTFVLTQTVKPASTITTVTLSPTSTYIPTETFTQTIDISPTTTDTLTPTLPAIPGAGCVDPDAERVKAQVVRVIDGDTIVVNINGTDYHLRYIGMDAPETGSIGGSQATAYNSQLVSGKTVILVKDVSEVDRYDRLLRCVFVGNIFVNYEMVRAGYAHSGSWLPDTACDTVFSNAYTNAFTNQMGLWAPQSPVKGSVSLCPKGCTTPPPGCLIKGNISSSGEKIYHMPGQTYYTQTVINPSKGERWFCTEQEAINNGWRKSKS